MSGTVVARHIAATPARSAADAWAVIVNMVTTAGGTARGEFDRAAGIMMSLIAAEAPKDSAIVIHGVGPRLRLYCVYDEEAVLGEGVSEDPLHWCPTDGDWRMSVPCPEQDLDWIQRALAQLTTRITVRDQSDAGPADTGDDARKAVGELGQVDWEAFLRS
jgi:hypothetical protein